MKRLTFLLIFLLLCSSASYADGIALSQTLDKSDIAYEDSVIFEITLKWDGTQSAYLFNKPLNPSIDRLKIRGFTSSISSDHTSGKEKTTKKFQYVLIPTSSGLGNIEPVSISYLKWPDSIPGEMFTEAMAVNIATPKKVEPEKDNNFIWYIIICLVVIIGAGLVAIKIVKSQKTNEIKKTAKELLFDDLIILKNETSSDLKKFQSGLYKIIIEFLNNEFDIKLTDYNENEFYEKLKETKLTNEQLDKLSTWLAKAQEAKYSPVSSAPGDTIRLESEVRDFFEKL